MAFLLALLVLGGAFPVRGQPPPKIDATVLALNWLSGRFLIPVTCVKTDGSRVHLEEAVVIRGTQQRGSEPSLRATFFGIDVADVSHCYNLAEPRVPDRRGVVYLTYRSHRRADLGTADFRRALRDGRLRYAIEGGQLQERVLGGNATEPRVVTFDGRDVELIVSLVKPGSDADKLLRHHTPITPAPEGQRAPRRLTFQIEGPEDFSFTGHFIEDLSRWQ
jgi:hypothetical protein